MREGRGLSSRSESLERAADAILHKAARAEVKPASRWTIFSDPEREAELLRSGRDERALAEYARALDARHDPRGALAALLVRSDSATVSAFIKARRSLLFARTTGQVPLRHVTLDRWVAGFLDRASIRLDKMPTRDFKDFLATPAARFLRELQVDFIDPRDDASLKLARGRAELDHVCNVVRLAPCRDALEVVLVRSLDPQGQPDAVAGTRLTLPSTATRPLPRLREFHLAFDSA